MIDVQRIAVEEGKWENPKTVCVQKEAVAYNVVFEVFIVFFFVITC